MRLQIQNQSGHRLQLLSNTSLQLTLESPVWFGDRRPDVLATVKTYSFTVPNTAHNRLLLDRPDLLDNPNTLLVQDGWSIHYDEWLLFTGRIEVEDTEKDSDFRITFVGGLAGSLAALRDKPLSTIFADDVREIGNALTHAKTVLTNPLSFDYVFPTIRTAPETTLDDATNPEQYEFVNKYDGTNFVTDAGSDRAASIIPMFRVHRILRTLLGEAGMQLTGEFDAGEFALELRNLILFNNVTLDRLASVPSEGDPAFTDVALGDSIRVAEHLPEMPAGELLKQIASTLGMAIFLDAGTRQVNMKFQKNLLTGTAVNWTSKVDPLFIRQRPVEYIPTRFAYDHPSDDLYPERWPLRLNGRPVAFRFTTYAAAEAGLSASDVGSVVYVESYHQYFELRGFVGGVPQLATLGKRLGIANEDAPFAYPIETGTLYMATPTERDGIPVLHPFVSGQEFLPAWYGALASPWLKGDKLNSLLLLFWRGVQFDPTTSLTYPLAAANSYSLPELRVGNLSLYFEGEDSIYEKLHAPWIRAIERMQRVRYATRLTATDLATLDFSKQVQIDQHRYLLKTVQVTLTPDTISTSIIEYMQLN